MKPAPELPVPKKVKHRVIINPDDVLSFEVSKPAQELYSHDEYKYLIHYARAFPEGYVPVMQYLLILFHPLIIKIAGHYAGALHMEWRDLISFVRQKFVELIYRFNLNSTLYFRMYIQTALRRAVYDRVLFESRRKILSNTVSLDTLQNSDLPESMIDCNCDWTFQSEAGEEEDQKEAIVQIIEFVRSTNLLTDMDRKIFELRFSQGLSIEQTCRVLNEQNFKIVERQRFIRKVVVEYVKENLV